MTSLSSAPSRHLARAHPQGKPSERSEDVAVDQAALRELSDAFDGDLIEPVDAAYEEQRRVWNGSIDRYPALITRCTSASDVSAAVRFTQHTGLPLAVRGGGHSFAGHSVCDAGIVIDLSPMKRIRVDPETREVSAQAGVLLGELDRATQRSALAVPSGIVTHTGLAGLTLGGGIGWLMRKYGLTIDQLLSVDVVTAEAEPLRASGVENRDLFWGIRGGGGNFGIVTEFRFRLNTLGPIVLAGPIFWPMSDSVKVLRFYRDWITDVPDELTTIVVHRLAPATPVLPEKLHGKPVIAIACCYAGPPEDGERVVRPLRAFGRPLLDLCRPKPFVEHQAMFDPTFPHGRWCYFRAAHVTDLSDTVIDVAADQAARIGTPHTSFAIFHLGGAVARAGDGDTAFSGRDVGHTFNLNGIAETPDGFDEQREWVNGFSSALEPHGAGVYVNFLMDEGQGRVHAAYGPERFERLKALKRRYDPENRFRFNQNIPLD